MVSGVPVVGEYVNFLNSFLEINNNWLKPKLSPPQLSRRSLFPDRPKRYGPSLSPECYRAKQFLHLLGQRFSNIPSIRALRGYVRRDVALEEDLKVAPVRRHNLFRCPIIFKFDVAV